MNLSTIVLGNEEEQVLNLPVKKVPSASTTHAGPHKKVSKFIALACKFFNAAINGLSYNINKNGAREEHETSHHFREVHVGDMGTRQSVREEGHA